MEDLSLLANWISDPTAAEIRTVASGGFSGARVWKVKYRGQTFALRQWPVAAKVGRVAVIHQFQRWLASQHIPVPVPVRERATGQTVVSHNGAPWELATWMPGDADYDAHPQPEKLAAALRSLAELHLSAARLPGGLPDWMKKPGVSPALMRRSERLCNLVLSDAKKLQAAVRRQPPSERHRLAEDALALVERTAEVELQKSQRWEMEPLPLQMCLRDVWHDHMLFTGCRVTGIIDFGAIGFDSPAGDVARLLGSMVGDDRDRWRLGLEAYEAVKPLTANERDAIRFFDSSGIVLSAVNWVHWLFRDSSALAATVDRSKAYQRLERLTARLRTLAATSRS